MPLPKCVLMPIESMNESADLATSAAKFFAAQSATPMVTQTTQAMRMKCPRESSYHNAERSTFFSRTSSVQWSVSALGGGHHTHGATRKLQVHPHPWRQRPQPQAHR